MTKHELVAEMSKELGITQKKCGETLNVLLEEIVRTLETAEVKERTGRNPANGKMMLYPQKRKLRFKASDILKDEINE